MHYVSPVADPGFPREGGTKPRGRGCQHTIRPHFPKKLRENKKKLPRGGASLESPLDPPLLTILSARNGEFLTKATQELKDLTQNLHAPTEYGLLVFVQTSLFERLYLKYNMTGNNKVIDTTVQSYQWSHISLLSPE